MSSYISDIVGILETTFNLERRDPGVDERLNVRRLIHVLEGEEVMGISGDKTGAIGG